MLWASPIGSGCGAAWLARLLGVQEVPSSNLGSPTKFLKDLRTRNPPQVASWSPTGVQNWTPAYSPAAVGPRCFLSALNSPELSTPRKTRQTRQFASNSLIMRIRCVSGSPRNPTTNPTTCPRKPDKSAARPTAHLRECVRTRTLPVHILFVDESGTAPNPGNYR